jgi:hypothetical protein
VSQISKMRDTSSIQSKEVPMKYRNTTCAHKITTTAAVIASSDSSGMYQNNLFKGAPIGKG